MNFAGSINIPWISSPIFCSENFFGEFSTNESFLMYKNHLQYISICSENEKLIDADKCTCHFTWNLHGNSPKKCTGKICITTRTYLWVAGRCIILACRVICDDGASLPRPPNSVYSMHKHMHKYTRAEVPTDTIDFIINYKINVNINSEADHVPPPKLFGGRRGMQFCCFTCVITIFFHPARCCQTDNDEWKTR